MGMNLQPFDAYRYYLSIKMHFESDTYDAVKYQFKTSAKPQSFWKRKDKHHFAKVAKRFNDVHDMIHFYVAHIVSGNRWVGDMLNDDDTYINWIKRNQALSYAFEQDINKISLHLNSFDDLFKTSDGSPYPNIIRYYMEGEINIETVVIIDYFTGFLNKTKINDPILGPEVFNRIRKYKSFVSFDSKKMKEIIFRVFTS